MRGTIKRIHVDQAVIRRNLKHNEAQPCLTVQNRGKSSKADLVLIDGPSVVLYRPDQPLSCGARCWVETRAVVIVDGVEID